MTTAPLAVFDHLLAMSNHHGTFEHADHTTPRVEHGFCTDDMARVLVVTAREPEPRPSVRRLSELALRFLGGAEGADGGYRNRMSAVGQWLDTPSLDDCWGRSIWGLGTAAARSDTDWVRQTARAALERAVLQRSGSPRAMRFAGLGAAELLAVQPAHALARRLLTDVADALPTSGDDVSWPWPEARLSYANAVLPEVMIAAGTLLDRPALQRQGLDLLAWLLDHETFDGHLSVTPAGGASAGDPRPAFDQQPIEVAALVDACARAARVDDDPRWIAGIAAGVDWFLGVNDSRQVMWDEQTGGGFDGLEAHGVNRNEGAESTLALLSTLQHARCLVPVAP